MKLLYAQSKRYNLLPAQYLDYLITRDTRPLEGDIWAEPLPWAVEKQYIQEAMVFYEEDLNHPYPTATTADELTAKLEEDETA